MGNPLHFSLEVPKRAHQLLRDLYEHLGESEGTRLPLKATFLLSVSMPIVILPIERILKYRRGANSGHMNDAVLNPKLADAVDQAIDLQAAVHQADFFMGPWEFASLDRGEGFPNLAADGLPDAIAGLLDMPAAIEDARTLSANRFCKILRNALAHGGILYLDEDGRSSSTAPVQRFAFVSTDNPNAPTKLLFLRIGMADYRAFLQKWVEWLKTEAINEILAEDVGVDATESSVAIILEDAAEATAATRRE